VVVGGTVVSGGVVVVGATVVSGGPVVPVVVVVSIGRGRVDTGPRPTQPAPDPGEGSDPPGVVVVVVVEGSAPAGGATVVSTGTVVGDAGRGAGPVAGHAAVVAGIAGTVEDVVGAGAVVDGAAGAGFTGWDPFVDDGMVGTVPATTGLELTDVGGVPLAPLAFDDAGAERLSGDSEVGPDAGDVGDVSPLPVECGRVSTAASVWLEVDDGSGRLNPTWDAAVATRRCAAPGRLPVAAEAPAAVNAAAVIEAITTAGPARRRTWWEWAAVAKARPTSDWPGRELADPPTSRSQASISSTCALRSRRSARRCDRSSTTTMSTKMARDTTSAASRTAKIVTPPPAVRSSQCQSWFISRARLSRSVADRAGLAKVDHAPSSTARWPVPLAANRVGKPSGEAE
jgi:hypothetical protein